MIFDIYFLKANKYKIEKKEKYKIKIYFFEIFWEKKFTGKVSKIFTFVNHMKIWNDD